MKISDELIKACEYFGEKIGIAADWSNENIVPYIKELCGKYIKWEIATSIIWLIILMIAAVLLGLCIRYFIKIEYDDELWLPVIVASVLIIGFIIFNIFNITKAVVFPELMLYQELSKYI